MDNGHTNPPDNLLKFPTPNNVEANDNLDLSNPETSWDQPIPTEHDKKAIGSSALNPVELSMPPSTQEITPPLGEITEHSLQPEAAPKFYQFPLEQNTTDKTTDANIVEESIATGLESVKTTDKLTEESVKATDEFINQFEKGKINLENFYDVSRDAMENNLDNSFGRKIGEKTEEKEAA